MTTRSPRDPVDDMADRLAALTPRLDALAERRVLQGLRVRIAADAHASPRRLRVALAAGLMVAAAVLALLWTREPPRGAQEATARSVPRAPAPALPAPTQPAPLLAPYLVAGTTAERALALLAHPVDQLVLGAGERVHANLGEVARIDVLGPAQLTVRASAGSELAVFLTQGTLLGDYTHALGGRLTITSPGATSEIVGTLFMVQVVADGSRVAVAHGSVRVRAQHGELLLTASQVLERGAHTPSPLPEADLASLHAHEQQFVASSGAQGIIGIAAQGLRADVAGQALADTPLWVKMPSGAHTISLHDAGARTKQLHTEVGVHQVVELSVPAAALPAAAARSGRALRSTPLSEHTAPSPSAADLYRDAEAAMREGALVRASDLLAQLVNSQPDASSVDLALYELADIALRSADYGRARHWLQRLEQHGARPALREPAAFLRCRSIRVSESADRYAECLAEFVARYPDSARAPEVKAQLLKR